MKKIQKKLRGSFNVFSNSARQLEVPLIFQIVHRVLHIVTVFDLEISKQDWPLLA